MIGRARQFITAAILTLGLAGEAAAIDLNDWNSVVAEAKGQTVYFNAWGGAENINAYIRWAGDEMKARYGVTVVHVKLDDTAKAVATVVAEKSAGKDHDGAVDLVWINGENFAAMKREGLLFSPDWATKLPNWIYVDHETKPTVLTDFTIVTEGLESPWGGAKLVFFYDSARTPTSELPNSAADLLKWAEANPGRFSYPQPPDFTGSSFLKQVLTELIHDKTKLQMPVDEATFAADAAPLFAYLDKLTRLLWREGKAYPQNYPDMKQKFADGELDIIFAFNPAEASAAIANGELPGSVRSFVFSGGTLGNTHFVAIPYNASAKAGALLFANFLLSPEAQLHKQDPKIWGDPTVLSLAKLPAAERQAFEALDLGVATLGPDQLGPALAEPHPDWMTRIEAEWTRRYGAAN
ncbi:ABC transporter substrate-binding protein [Sinorhizobium mexicanum]|uniref:ABC transporter substrate-binding protein n=1 Tax=Sinorhizobium mexicanum TaxID=375549 RepID=A0A859QBG8_9HYPH|nr:ABC transporter substrate-binding protein [Sinorhizobium mexicanum]MBP1885452.1 putative thiamine transport system substrate-binding protein [Sinorhizobium mexicanum]QLL60003.1 ABC transporter substrate-binding protein [Sinorhizobium mexicanum]